MRNSFTWTNWSAWDADARRYAPRIPLLGFCWEVDGRIERHAAIIDLSSEGACLERPYVGGATPANVYLELDVPGLDEVLRATADPCYDQLVQAPHGTDGGPLGLLQRTGFRLVNAASRDLRLIRDFVFETRRANWRAAEEDWQEHFELATAWIDGKRMALAPASSV